MEPLSATGPGGIASGMELTPATDADAGVLFSMINQAFEVEMGSTGLAFKSTQRLDDPIHGGMREAYAEHRVIVARDTTRTGGTEALTTDTAMDTARDSARGVMMGCACIVWHVHGDGTTLEFGKLAVSTEHQRKGVGRALVDHVVAIGRGKGCTRLEISVLQSWCASVPACVLSVLVCQVAVSTLYLVHSVCAAQLMPGSHTRAICGEASTGAGG